VIDYVLLMVKENEIYYHYYASMEKENVSHYYDFYVVNYEQENRNVIQILLVAGSDLMRHEVLTPHMMTMLHVLKHSSEMGKKNDYFLMVMVMVSVNELVMENENGVLTVIRTYHSHEVVSVPSLTG